MKKYLALVLAVVMLFSCLPTTVFAADGNCTITVKDATGMPGNTVSVDIAIQNNPGIQGATLNLAWDTGLMLKNVTNGEAFSMLNMTPPGNLVSGRNFVWYRDAKLQDSEIKDGTILKLVFEVSAQATAGQKLTVSASYVQGDIFNRNLQPVTVDTTSGKVSVVTYTPGDVNGDTRINAMDLVLLSRYIADGCTTDPQGYNVSLNPNAGDVDDNGRLNALDLVYISRYIADGCVTDREGYDVVLKPSSHDFGHTHMMQATPYKAPTCTEIGNIAYWYCKSCGKYYSNAAGTTEITLSEITLPLTDHTEEVIPATATTTEGKKCSACGKVLVEPVPVQKNEHGISYDVSNGDPYLKSLLNSGEITNDNPQKYTEGTGLTLKNLAVEGYRFLGWYDGAGGNATQVKKIETTSAEDVELYAHWEKITYTVQLKSDVFIDQSSLTYTVDTGVALPTPRLSNYVFAGWSGEDGTLYNGKKIPAGTTGNFFLNANWTSERNKTFTKAKLDAPIIVEDEENNTILFAYEIGEIQNVPLYTVKDFGYISGDGVTRTATETYAVQIDETLMNTYTQAMSTATTESSNWTLSQDWNEITSVNEQWCNETGRKVGDAETIAKSETGSWYVSNGLNGSTETAKTTTNQRGWENEVKVYSEKEKTTTERDLKTDTKSWNINGELNYTPKSYSAGIGIGDVKVEGSTSGGLGGKIGGGYEHKWGTEQETVTTDKNKSGFELSGKQNASTTSTLSTKENAGWNTEAGFSSSSTASQSRTVSTELSEKISQSTGYGKEYAKGEQFASGQGLSSTAARSDEYGTSVTYGLKTSKEVTNTWTTQATKPGYHRWIVAGTAHVFGVVGYDIAKDDFFVYTYTVMDDEQHDFEDYSNVSAAYNDNENGVISFEIPIEVIDYVTEHTSQSAGLKVDVSTGKVTEYTGTDTCVVIPEYFNTGNGDVVKITGFTADAFRGQTQIEAVQLSDYITEIPAHAFDGCTSLIGISGGTITKIGEYAFSGCTSAMECGVLSTVTELGDHAFAGVGGVIVNAANAQVAKAAANSGARQIVLCTDYMKDSAGTLDGATLTIPSGTEYFEFNGNKQTFLNMTIASKAAMTAINKANFVSKNEIPIQIDSQEVILNQVTVDASGIGVVLTGEEGTSTVGTVHLGLQGTVSVNTEGDYAVLVKTPSVYEYNTKAVGKMILQNQNSRFGICGTLEGSNLLEGMIVLIDSVTFDNLLHSYTVNFDPAGGICDTTPRQIPNGTPVGTLPAPVRDYYTFEGWYDANGKQVTAKTAYSDGMEHKLTAHWRMNDVYGWVKASTVPAGAEIVNRKYSYTKTYYTTGSNPTLSGWTQYDHTWTWGSWSGWGTWDPGTNNGERDRESRWVDTSYNVHEYHYYHYCCSSGETYLYTYKKSSSYQLHEIWLNYQLEYKRNSGNINWYGFYNCPSGNSRYWFKANGEANSSVVPFERDRWVSDGHTEWRYRDKIHTYYFKSIENLESTTYPSGSNISNIVEWVQYRAK